MPLDEAASMDDLGMAGVMDRELAGQVAVVTGATEGIGRAIVRALSEAGAAVAILARTRENVEALAAELRARGGAALPLAVDVTDAQAVEAAFQSVQSELAAPDILVNNAGTGVRKRFDQMATAEWRHLLDLNLGGVFNCTRAALRCMQERRRGCIINIASKAGRWPEPDMAVYSATKAAVIAFTQALAQEVDAQGIRLMAVCPGPVDTERIRRLAPHADRTGWLLPEDVARAIAFLASSQAPRWNGAILDLYH